ncbi:DUF4469 domain-containing protein [Flavobacterium sp. B17]|uniref:DUF4469 domain-containing protein n=1 Tax=Flavobacterium sp. B17 TaxID=95618 RepID=UPI0021CD9747|nr:DUF4469 domain-containing protein [Flavobacterium sp. B17]
MCEAVASRGGADVSASAMEHATELFLKEMAYQLCDGFSVNTGYFTASTTIRGVFDSPSETFNKDKHSIIFQFNQGEKLRAEIPNIEVSILGVAESSAVILQVTDVKSGSVNDLLTPGRNLKILGSKIKVTGEDPSVGIYFVDATTQAKTKVEQSDIVINNPSEVMVVIPELPSGSYNLEIVTQFTDRSMLKQPRTALLDKPLTVE